MREILRREPVSIKTLFIINDPPMEPSELTMPCAWLSPLRSGRARRWGSSSWAMQHPVPRRVSRSRMAYYNLERMLKAFHAQGGVIGVCTGCMDARGLREVDLVEGALRANLEELTDWTVMAEKVLVF